MKLAIMVDGLAAMFPEPMIETVIDQNGDDRSTVKVTISEWLRTAEDWPSDAAPTAAGDGPHFDPPGGQHES